MDIKESKIIIGTIIDIFKSFYGKKYEKLIDERMSSLVDIIFYNNHEVKRELNNIDDYLREYDIEKYNDEIINKKIPFSRYVVEHGEQGTMMFLDDDKLRTIIYFPIETNKQYHYDCILIHELLHVLDEHIIYKDESSIISRGGFETMILKGEKESNERNYEFFNEMIHQRIAEEITLYANNRNIFLFNTQEESNKSAIEYEKDQCEVIEKFYQVFKDKLIIDKMLGNADDFISYIGVENFEELNNWIINFYNKYQTPEERINAKSTKEYLSIINDGMTTVNKCINY